MQPSESGVHGPGIYFYDNLEDAKAYAEPNGGVIVGEVDVDSPGVQMIEKPVKMVGTDFVLRTTRIIVVPDSSMVRVIQIIPTDQT